MKKLLLVIFVILLLPLSSFAQADTIPNLVISEWRGDGAHGAYLELTNMGDTTLDLSKVTLCRIQSKPPDVTPLAAKFILKLKGLLEPGESWVVCNVFEERTEDGRLFGRPAVQAIADTLIFMSETATVPGGDSVSVFNKALQWWKGHAASVIWYTFPNGDSALIDGAGNEINPADGKVLFDYSNVAGIENATETHTLVRKFSITKPNPDFTTGRGVDLEDSEWIPIPHNFYHSGDVPTTIGNHGDFSISLESSVIEINFTDTTLTVPWGILKGDSIIDEFTLGPGMSWWYLEDPTSIADSAYTTVQTGDILQIFACGIDLERMDFMITMADAAVDNALVFPKRNKIYPDPIAEPSGEWTTYYYVTDEYEVDTIGDVPFTTRVDSLFKYLEKAADASWEIVWIDGMDRVDLKNGDILKVTAEDGSTVKEYFIDVQPYAASSDAHLGAITWPDMPEDFKIWGIDQGWTSDTIPGFSQTTGSYVMILPYGTKQIPALKVYKADLNSTIVTESATTLKGSMEEKTTSYTVTAEDDSTSLIYSVVFMVESLQEHLQVFETDPIISEWSHKLDAGNFLELANPGNIDLDMSQYMIVLGLDKPNPADVIQQPISFDQRYFMYVPGYRFTDDTLYWNAEGAQKLTIDASVDPVVAPGKTFLIGGFEMINNAPKLGNRVNIMFAEDVPNAWNQTFGRWDCIVGRAANNGAHYLFKIDNDSILDGTKAIGDPEDFTLIDVFGHNTTKGWEVAGLVSNAQKGHHYVRLPQIWQGNPDFEESAGTSPEDSEWFAEWRFKEWDYLRGWLGNHEFDPLTVYISTVSSTVYSVDDGYEGDLSIGGMSNSETVEQFYASLIKADTGQVLSVHSNADGSVKALGGAVEAGDTLRVTSADAMSTTKYVLDINPLDDNAMLTVEAAQADSYAVAVDGTEGTISGSGVAWGASILEIMDALIVPDLATFNVIDQDGDLVPLQRLNSDTVYALTPVSDRIFIEVTAENGVNKITYQFMPSSLSSDAFVVSGVYKVMEQAKIIANIPDRTSVSALMTNVEAVTGATMKVIDKAGFNRPLGIVSYDDRLVVVSEDGTNTVNYYLTFFNELRPDAPNQAPAVSIVAEATAVKGATLSFTADVADDGLPEGSALTYLWEVTAGDASNVTIASADQMTTEVTFSDIGNYDLSLAVSDGELSITVVHSITVTPGVGIEMLDLSTISIYPNPARHTIHVKFGMATQVESQIRIVDMIGKMAYIGNHFDNQVQIGLDELEAGVYFMIINVEEQSLIRKLSILK